ncbi:MAG: hypothetical protein ACLSG5_14400 [Oscillospiraceae bacterium]
MFFLSQDGMRLVESSHLYINESSIFAVINGGEDVELAHFELYGAAQEAPAACTPPLRTARQFSPSRNDSSFTGIIYIRSALRGGHVCAASAKFYYTPEVTP